MSDPKHLITIVIASRCNDARAESLKLACESVRAAAGGLDYSILVVANGKQVSPAVLGWLASRTDTRLVQLQTGSHPLARRIGAEMADAEFVGFLDDDDVLLPDTLERKISYFREHPEVDVLVTDGWRITGTNSVKIFPPPDKRSSDFVETMMHSGWGACSMTLRTQTVDLSALDAEMRHMEWTLTALLLARDHRMGFLDEPTYRYRDDTPGSLSKQSEHNLAAPEVWRRISKTYAGTSHHTAMRRRYGIACHNASWEFANRGELAEAWQLHLESLKCPGGFAAYLVFTGKLALAAWRHRSS